MRNLLQGKNIDINAIKAEDFDRIGKWYNNIEFLRCYDTLPAIPLTLDATKTAINEMNTNSKSLIFAIREKESQLILGVIGFLDIVWTNGTATFFIGIGETSYTGKGIGTEAVWLMLDYGFNELNLHRIGLNVIAYNTAAIRLYEKSGFVLEGAGRQMVYRDGHRHDLLFYGLLHEEWNNRGLNH